MIRHCFCGFLLSLPLLASADYYPPSGTNPYTPESTTGTTTSGTNATLDQQVNTSTAQGLKIFDQVTYQNMSTDKTDFLQSDDDSSNGDSPKTLKISGSSKSGGL